MKRLTFLIALLGGLALACRGGSATAISTPLSLPTTASNTEAAPTSMPWIIPATRIPSTSIPPTREPTLAAPPTVELPPTAEISAQSQGLSPTVSDMTYCTLGGVDLKMDVYLPEDRSQLAPVVMYVHGGGWAAGDKRNGPSLAETAMLIQNGFAVFSVNYRLAPEFLFPAMIQDVKCAVRSIRAHAADFNINPDRIGVWGASAGGHLASLMGTADESAGFDVGQYLEYSSRVQAVVDMFGPTDLTAPMTTDQQVALLTNAFPSNLYAAGSPVTYVTPDDPPFLILHGDRDVLVPVEQAFILYNRLNEQSVPAKLVIVQNAGHGFSPVGGTPDPDPAQIPQMVLDFFNQYLR